VIYAVTKWPVGFIEDRYGLKLQLLKNVVCEMQIASYIKIRSLVPETSKHTPNYRKPQYYGLFHSALKNTRKYNKLVKKTLSPLKRSAKYTYHLL